LDEGALSPSAVFLRTGKRERAFDVDYLNWAFEPRLGSGITVTSGLSVSRVSTFYIFIKLWNERNYVEEAEVGGNQYTSPIHEK
jgi:hypothetical protein